MRSTLEARTLLLVLTLGTAACMEGSSSLGGEPSNCTPGVDAGSPTTGAGGAGQGGSAGNAGAGQAGSGGRGGGSSGSGGAGPLDGAVADASGPSDGTGGAPPDTPDPTDVPSTCSDPVEIADPALLESVRKATGTAVIRLADMAKLTELTVAYTQQVPLVSLNGLECAVSLQTLLITGPDLPWMAGVKVSPIASLKNLTRLEWYPSERILGAPASGRLDLSSLAFHPALQSLRLEVDIVDDISVIKTLHLTSLRLWSDALSDVTPLADAKELTQATLVGRQIKTIEPLMKGLSSTYPMGEPYITVAGTQVSDLTPLAPFTTYRGVVLSDNRIQDISPLGGFTKLVSLDVSLNHIQDISPVRSMSALKFLTAIGNAISDVTPVAGLSNLSTVSMRNNLVSDLSPIAVSTSLPAGYWDLRGNPIDCQAQAANIATLRSRGNTIELDCP